MNYIKFCAINLGSNNALKGLLWQKILYSLLQLMMIDKTIILVHGAGHGAWCWKKVAKELTSKNVIVLDLPGRGKSTQNPGSLVAAAKAVRDAVKNARPPVILCGHSCGGTVITEAIDDKTHVDRLVYIAAAMPDVGESVIDNVPEFTDSTIGRDCIPNTGPDGLIRFTSEIAIESLYHDCDAETTKWAAEQLCSEHLDIFITPANNAPWKQIDTTYVICSKDRVFPVSAQERLSRLCNHRIIWDTGHSPMLSQPDIVVSLLNDMADEI